MTEIQAPPDLPIDIRALCEKLSSHAADVDHEKAWPTRQIHWLREAGVFRWFLPKEYGGDAWNEAQIVDGYLALSQSCLTTTFILTQWNAACKRLLGSSNLTLKSLLLPHLADGTYFATVGISHLTTSRQHLGEPVLRAHKTDGGFRLDGCSPWVTGGLAADYVVTGAVLDDGQQIMAAVDANSTGYSASPGTDLVALTSSCTDKIEFDAVYVPTSHIVAGPVPDVMKVNSGGGAGGLQTSTLAIGLTMAASRYLMQQTEQRPGLVDVAQKISNDVHQLCGHLRSLSVGDNSAVDSAELRREANSLVLRSTQAALSAAKGAGFVTGHPAGRWAREALFFLVWSCPQSVMNANLCELAQLPADE